jgi:hypothetical protein
VPRLRLLALPLLLALVLGVAACGGSKRQADVTTPALGSDTAPTTPTTAPATTIPTTPTATTPATTTPPRTTPTTTTPMSPSSPQGTGGAQAGCDGSVAGGFIRNVQAGGTDCARAKDVASAWFAAVHGGAAPNSQVSAAGYTCGATMAGERASVSCTAADGSKIIFTASP